MNHFKCKSNELYGEDDSLKEFVATVGPHITFFAGY